MKNKLISILLALSFFPTIIFCQEINTNSKKARRLNLYLGLSTLIIKTDYTISGSNEPSPGYLLFPSTDISLTLNPKKEQGWIIDYNNYFLGDGLSTGFLKLIKVMDHSSFSELSKLSSGIFGRLDFKKKFVLNDNNWFSAGFILSDKFITGIFYQPSSYGPDEFRGPEAEGYFITPGLLIELSRTTPRDRFLSINSALTPSLFNLWETNSNINYRNHLFLDINCKIQTAKGWYCKAGFLSVIPYYEYSPKFRLDLTIGHQIF